MIIADTSGLFAAIDADAEEHNAVVAVLDELSEPPVVSPFVVAELDYLLTTRFGSHVAATFLEDVSSGEYELAGIDDGDVGAALGIVRRYADMSIGVTDASQVVLAARYGTTELLTLDQRHFRAMTPMWGAPAFTLRPAGR